MAGRLLGTILIISFLTYMVLLSSFYFMHQSIINNINSINYNVCELISTSGVFSKQAYSYLKDNLSRYGDYKIVIKYEKQLKPGIYDTYYFEKKDLNYQMENNPKVDEVFLVNRNMKMGDRVTVYVEDQELTFFGKLINATFLGYQRGRFLDTRIKSVKSCVVASDAKGFIKGYDVISQINNFNYTTGLTIKVITKLNPSGKIYNASNHRYGDSIDEQVDSTKGIPGDNYIFSDGDFIKEETAINVNGTMVKPDPSEADIIFIQQ